MKKIILVILGMTFLFQKYIVAQNVSAKVDYTKFVNVFIGTGICAR